MPDRTQNRSSRTGEFKLVDAEPRLEREKERPTIPPEIEAPPNVGSATGIMRIRREGTDDTAEGDEDNPV